MYVGELVRLRSFEQEDAERYRTWINDADVARLVDRAKPVTRLEHQAWYQNLVTSDSNVVFAVERVQDREFIGLVWLYGIHWRHRLAEVRIVIGDRKSWGSGYGTEALRLLTQIAFGPINLEKLWADVLASNPRAVAAFERAGFVQEGTLRADRIEEGARVDVIRLGLQRGERHAAGEPPRKES